MTDKEVIITLHVRYIMKDRTSDCGLIELIKSTNEDVEACDGDTGADKAFFVGCPHTCNNPSLMCHDCWDEAMKEFMNKEGGPTL